jgi:cbb3-type cytochrome oxidase subunit 3
MKLISNLLESVEEIRIWYIIALLIFFVMFIIITIRILKKPRKEMDEIKNSILDESDETKE